MLNINKKNCPVIRVIRIRMKEQAPSPVGSDMGHGSDPVSVWSLHVLWIVGQGNCAKPGWATRPLRFSPKISYFWSCFWTDPCTPLVQHVLHLQRMRANVLGLSGWLYRTLRARRPVLLPLGWTWAWRLSQLSRVVPKVWTAGLQAAKWPEFIVFHNTQHCSSERLTHLNDSGEIVHTDRFWHACSGTLRYQVREPTLNQHIRDRPFERHIS